MEDLVSRLRARKKTTGYSDARGCRVSFLVGEKLIDETIEEIERLKSGLEKIEAMPGKAGQIACAFLAGAKSNKPH